MALVSLADYKRAIKETSAANDTFHQDALDAAESAVLVYTDRDFGSAVTTASKTYWYDGSGILNIDDADTVNTVTFVGAAALPGTAWIAKTDGPPSITVYTYLELPQINWYDGSIEDSLGVMGFTSNLDQYLFRNRATRELQVTVNAAFGWATVPPDVKRAVIWTASSFEEVSGSSGGAGDLSAKSVAEVSESWFAESPGTQSEATEAIPARARALLNPYARARL
jgi:hypothetical protein